LDSFKKFKLDLINENEQEEIKKVGQEKPSIQPQILKRDK
jgi:hypothetical protein